MSHRSKCIIQLKEFNEIMKIDGVILTKLDGTAKGGIVLAIEDQLSIPVKYIGWREDKRFRKV